MWVPTWPVQTTPTTILGTDGSTYAIDLSNPADHPHAAEDRCVCDIAVLMARGCKCGAMARERAAKS